MDSCPASVNAYAQEGSNCWARRKHVNAWERSFCNENVLPIAIHACEERGSIESSSCARKDSCTVRWRCHNKVEYTSMSHSRYGSSARTAWKARSAYVIT